MTAARTGVTIRPHVITTRMPDGRMRCYVRSAHAADVYYRVESSYGRLACTCPIGQRHAACEHLAIATRRAM